MKPITDKAKEFIQGCKIAAHVDFDPKRQPHHEAQDVLLKTVSKHLAAKEAVTTEPVNGVTRKGVELWVFTRKELTELIEKIQGL